MNVVPQIALNRCGGGSAASRRSLFSASTTQPTPMTRSRAPRSKMEAPTRDKQRWKCQQETIDTDKQTIYRPNDHFIQGFPLFEEIRRQGKLCDVVLQVDNQSFSAHRIVLAATIPYFNAMFLSDMVESTQKGIILRGIDAVALEALVNFAYSGKIALTEENVQSIMVGASFLQMHNVKETCASFLKKRFHPQNVLGIRHFADTLSCAPLVEEAEKYTHRFFNDIAQSEEFLNLPFNDVKDLISSNELYVKSEELVFEAVSRWVSHDTPNRAVNLPELLSRVRLHLLTPEYLSDHVSKHQLVRNSLPCRDLMDEARDYHLMPERRFLMESFKCGPRGNTSDVIGLIFVVGGLNKYGTSLSSVEVYDPVTNKWKNSEAMMMLRSRVGVAVHDGNLYAFGGYNGSQRLSTVEVYCPKIKMWKIIAPMHCKRSAVGTTALHDYLYACGGYDGVTSLNTVEKYCPKTDKWKLINSMNKHRSAGGVVAFEGCVYALGGHDGLSIFNSVEKYDPHTDEWTEVTPMLTRRCRLGVATLNRKMYVCGGYDGSSFLQSVEVFDPETESWKFVAPMNVKRSRAALVANVGKLWVIGGYDGTNNLSSVEYYDPSNDTWTFASPMSAHEGGVGVGVISNFANQIN